ncbi:MAG: hypothetical protein CVU90_00515 [Firmicutes bacterium HGW-Firmicutes-15]|nr:MAG: hypothetical protein CVU90_00515 [Firmicutes bacterium HGW-Firmicutes-15]
MRKMLTLVLMGLMLFGLAGSALAVEVGADNQSRIEKAADKVKVKELLNYDQLLSLREEGKANREQIKADNQQIKELIQAAKAAKNEEILPVIKEQRSANQALKADLKTLRESQKGNWEAMKAARQAQDQVQMQSIMDQIISVREAINTNLVEISADKVQFIEVLQGR